MRIKTKQDLLSRMLQLHACPEAYAAVQALPDTLSAKDAWKAREPRAHEWRAWYLCAVKSPRLYALMAGRSLWWENSAKGDAYWSWAEVEIVCTLGELRDIWDRK